MKIKEVQIEHPYYGYRKIWREINEHGGNTTETTVRRVMRRFGITAIFPGRNNTIPLSKRFNDVSPKVSKELSWNEIEAVFRNDEFQHFNERIVF